MTVPRDPLKEVFTEEVRAKWASSRNPSRALQWRLEVLGASGLSPSDPVQAEHLRWLRAHKSAWETYLMVAFACGMFDGERGTELRGRFIAIDDAGFRSAMAECMTCWFLADRMKLPVSGDAAGRTVKKLDMKFVLREGEVGVEVKAPFREPPEGTAIWYGDDSDKILSCVAAANKQFSPDSENLLVIAPVLRTRMFGDRGVLVRALYGESIITFLVNTRTGEGGEPRSEFSPRGKFLKPQKSGYLPACQRISTILCIEELPQEKIPNPIHMCFKAVLAQDLTSELFAAIQRQSARHLSNENEKWIDHSVLVLHNPHAYHPIPESVWGDLPQLVARRERMIWTDGYDEPV